MARRPQDLTGRKIGRLTVIAFAYKLVKCGRDRRWWNCLCECGNYKVIPGASLMDKSAKSCSCLKKETFGYSRKKPYDRNTPEYNSWNSVKIRCGYSKNISYKYYGGRGITVCKRWENDFQVFLLDMGEQPKDGLRYTIERIDSNGNYEPGNCKWATGVEQGNNKRNIILIEMNGQKKSVTQWCRIYNVQPSMVRYRIKTGCDLKTALELSSSEKRSIGQKLKWAKIKNLRPISTGVMGKHLNGPCLYSGLILKKML